jgi:hypothetical protein
VTSFPLMVAGFEPNPETFSTSPSRESFGKFSAVLTTSERPRATASRIKGKPAMVRSLRGLLLRVHRYGRGRARTPADITWTARVLDALRETLAAAEAPER